MYIISSELVPPRVHSAVNLDKSAILVITQSGCFPDYRIGEVL